MRDATEKCKTASCIASKSVQPFCAALKIQMKTTTAQLNSRVPQKLRDVIGKVADMVGVTSQDIVSDALAYSFGSREPLVVARRDLVIKAFAELVANGEASVDDLSLAARFSGQTTPNAPLQPSPVSSHAKPVSADELAAQAARKVARGLRARKPSTGEPTA